MTSVARMYGLACASAGLVLVGLIVYAEIDRAIRRTIRARRRRGVVDMTGNQNL